jgi:hypothetical protein
MRGMFAGPPRRSFVLCRAVQLCTALAKLGGVPGRRDGASSYVVAAPFCELCPAIRDQILGIRRRHLDGAI